MRTHTIGKTWLLSLMVVLAMGLFSGMALADDEGEEGSEATVTSIAYTPANDIQLIEGVDGYTTEDEEGQEYFEYRSYEFNDGDTLTVTGPNGDSVSYTFVDEDEDSNFVYAFVSDNGDKISGDDVSTSTDQYNNHWDVGDHSFTLTYMGKTCEVPVKVVANPVASIEFTPAAAIQLVEGIDGYTETDADGQEYFEYSWHGFQDEDTLSVTGSNGEPVDYAYDSSEYAFVSEDGDQIDADDVTSDWFDVQSTSHWNADEHAFTLTYMGKSCSVPVTVVANPVASIAYTPANPIQLVEGVNGYSTEDDDEQTYFRYSYYGAKGDLLTVAGTDGESTEYVLDADNSDFKASDGTYIDVSWESDQSDSHWAAGEQHAFTVTYMGKSCEVPVTVVSYAESVTVEETPLSAGGQIAVELSSGDKCYTFTPEESGYYRFYSKDNGSSDPSVTIRNASGVEIVSDDDSGGSLNFDCSCELEAGATYYVVVSNLDSSETASFTLATERAVVPDSLTATVKDGQSLTVGDESQGNWESYYDDDAEQEVDYFYFRQSAVADLVAVNASYEDGTSKEISQNYFEVEDFDCKTWEAGNSYAVTISYLGVTCTVEVPVVANPVDSISFSPVGTYVRYENYDGYLDEDAGYFKYYTPDFVSGDKLTVTRTDGTSAVYTFDDSKYSFVSQDGDAIDASYVYATSDQDEERWTLGDDNHMTVTYMSKSTQVPVSIVANPVKSISLVSVSPYEIVENDDKAGYVDEEEDGTKYFRYYLPGFTTGDALTVKYTDGTTKSFAFTELEASEGSDSFNLRFGSDGNGQSGTWTSSDGEALDYDRLSVSSDQDSAHWTLGDGNYFTIEYFGAECKVPVSIVGAKPADLGGASVSVANQTYTGNALQPAVTVKLDGKTLEKGTDYTVAYADNTNAGTATVTITGTGNYTGTATATFTIEKADVSRANVVVAAAAAYTGKAQTPGVTVTLAGKQLKSGADYAISYANNKNAGTATVAVTGKGNYTGTATGSFTIAKAANPMTAKGKTATVKAKNVKKKAQTVKAAKAFKVAKAQGKVTYKLSSAKKGSKSFKSKFKVSTAGKITAKKGLKKGTYTLKVKVTAAGNANYSAAAKTVTVKVKVK